MKSKYFWGIMALTLLFVGLFGYYIFHKKIPKPSKPVSELEIKNDVRGEHTFSFQFLHKLKPKENMAFSPISIRLSLGMALAGARGETESEIVKVLSIEKKENIHDVFATTLAMIRTNMDDSSYKLLMAQRIWGQEGHSFNNKFLDILSERYASPLESLDLVGNPEKSARIVNKWIDSETNGLIQNALSPNALTAESKLLLVNAIYFKAKWDSPFEKKDTAVEPFFLSDTEKTNVRMMSQRSTFKYKHLENLQILELPYEGDGTSMVIVLPDEKMGLEKLEPSFSEAHFAKWTSSLKRRKVDLKLPNFILNSDIQLRDPLTSMGMTSVFAKSKANFEGIDGTRQLFLDNVIHKVFVRVDEKGTEAAAATIELMGSLSAEFEDDLITFHADHPFLFFILDKNHGHILFMGRVVDPMK